jgi:hypothetical protein
MPKNNGKTLGWEKKVEMASGYYRRGENRRLLAYRRLFLPAAIGVNIEQRSQIATENTSQTQSSLGQHLSKNINFRAAK